MATLAVYRGDQFLREVEIGQAPTRIGRSPENELMLEDRDKGVSRAHAEIRYERGQYVIVDLNSQNGVWIGDKRVKADPIPINTPITVGPYRLVLLGAAPAPAAPALPPEAVGTLITPKPEERVPDQTELIEAADPTPARTVPAVKPAAKTPPPAPVAGKKLPIVPIAAGVGVVAVAVLAVVFLKRPTAPPPETITSTTTVPATTSEPPAVVPTAEEQFLDHYNKAQAFIAANDKAAATTENGEALKVLPADPRGVEQQTAIAAMKEPGAVASTTPETATSVPGVPPPEKANSPLRAAPRAGETNAQRSARERLAKTHLDDGKKALEDRRYADAMTLLQASMDTSGREDFGTTANEAANLLKTARAAKAQADAGQKRASAQKLVEDAKGLASSDIAGAVRRLRDARNIDPQVPGATELMNSLLEQAAVQGEAALSRAKNFDNFRRTDDAIKEYDRAVQLLELLPGGHKELASAKQRSAELKAR